MPELRLSFPLVDEWPVGAPVDGTRFADGFPAELQDRAVLLSLTEADDDVDDVVVPPTVFRGVEAVPYEVRLGPSLTVVRYRHVIRSTNRPPTP